MTPDERTIASLTTARPQALGGETLRTPGQQKRARTPDNTAPTPAESSSDENDDMFEDVGIPDDELPELGTVELDFGDTPSLLAARGRRPMVTKRARILRRSQHVAELICTLTSLQLMNHACSGETLGQAFSLIPAASIERMDEHLHKEKRTLRLEWFSADLHYFLATFSALRIRDRRVETGKSRGIDEEFIRFIETKRVARPWHRAMLLTSMLRALRFDVRFCAAISPLPLKLTVKESQELEGLGAVSEAKDELPTAKRAKLSPSKTRSSSDVPQYWCEIFDPLSDNWVPVNPLTASIENPKQLVRPSKTSPCKIPYIVSLDEQGYVRDITRRYTSEFVNITSKLRLKPSASDGRSWWDRWLDRWQNPALTERDDREEEQMAVSEARSAMPKRLSDFATNPIYVLKRNLKQNEVLYPDGPKVGTVRGEPVFLRENIQTLRTSMAWMRLGRAIKHGEQPIKTVKQRAVTARAKMQVEECEAQGKDAVSALFGEWQTELFRPPPVTNGKVPRNDYGRLDLFTESMLPEGATHIPHPDAKQLCKDLGIDCVEAVVRFEFRRGISTPIISGVVVPSDAAELLTDALAESTQNKVAQQRAAMERRAVKRWRRLLVALRVRKEVDDTFATRSSLPQGTTFKNKNKGKSIEIASSGTSSDEDEEDPIDTGGGFIL